MNPSYIEIEQKGKRRLIPTFDVGDRTVVVHGRWIRTASIYREDWMEEEPVEDPERFIPRIKELGLKADLFSFSRRLPETSARYPFHYDWDNVAAIPISSFEDWWNNRISRKTRQEVNRAQRLRVVARVVPFDEELIREIVGLFNRISMVQGQPFKHHGKDFEKVKKDISPYSDRSAFVGAYSEGELIGYMKIVFLRGLASILNIITDPAHFEKRPGNALMAEAVKICEKKAVCFLLYGKYAYGNKVNSSLAEFKRRNGFEMIKLPRYFVPLGMKGRIVTGLRLYRGALGLLPESLILPLLNVRSWLYRYILMPLRKGREGRPRDKPLSRTRPF